jgi:hypothetical protein
MDDLSSKISEAYKSFVAQYGFNDNERNRSRLFSIMEGLYESSGYSPALVSSWVEAHRVFAFEFEPRTKRKTRTAPVSKLTKAEIDTWSAARMEREMQSPRRAEEIEAALSVVAPLKQ